MATIDPADLDHLSCEDCIQHALTAHFNDPGLSLRSLAVTYKIPRSTLTDRFNGVPTRREGHAQQLKLTPAQETVLAEWIKVMARRGVPLSAETVRDHASAICGQPVGKTWIKRFMARHPDLHQRWTSVLEACRASSLNKTVVQKFYDIIEELINEYQIPPENIYNMDEKGIQMGIGKRIWAIVDRDQKEVQQTENGDCELVTIIETVCANGTSIRPSVIFKGQHRNLEWGRINPCNARFMVHCSDCASILIL
jgi:hypothetical protein